jgi:chitinase
MTPRVRLVVAGLAAAAAAVTALAPAAAAPAPKVAGAYFASWDVYGRGYFAKQIPADRLTHLFYAFGTPTADGGCTTADPWADYQMPYWTGDNSVDGVADVDPSGNFWPGQHVFGNFNQLRKLKAAHPNVRLLISIGGWTLSTYFSDAAATPASRAKFAAACIDTFIKGNLPSGGWPEQAGGPGAAAGLFDGLDIDWEYPGIDPGNGAHHSPADRHNATLLFQELRRQLDALGAQTGKHYLLTAALPAGNVNSTGSFELADVARTLDWVNLLTYDYHGPWDAQTNLAAPFGLDPLDPTPAALRPTWNVRGTVAYYEANGVSPDKIVVGVPFYAKQYLRVPAAGNGLYQPFDNTGLDPNTLQWDATPTPTYHDLVDVAKIVAPSSSIGNNGKGLNGYQRFWNEPAGEPWLYDPAGAHQLAGGPVTTGTFISYEDPHSIAERGQLVNSERLRGLYAWEISQDDDANALTDAMVKLLK